MEIELEIQRKSVQVLDGENNIPIQTWLILLQTTMKENQKLSQMNTVNNPVFTKIIGGLVTMPLDIVED